jgi:hypothetical protein
MIPNTTNSSFFADDRLPRRGKNWFNDLHD